MAVLPTRPKWRICVVDHHCLIRRGLGEVLAAEEDMEICGEADDANTAFNLIMKLTPDLVTTEITLPGNSGLELIKSIRGLDRNIGVLVISMCDELIYAERALRAGAHGFVDKQKGIGGLADAIRCILSGKFVLSPAAERHMLEREAWRAHAETSAVHDLTDRELEIGSLIGTGSTTREIAAQLGVSVKTIETHRSHIKQKLGLANGTRLLQFWSCWASREALPNSQLLLPEFTPPASNGNGTHQPPVAIPAANGNGSR